MAMHSALSTSIQMVVVSTFAGGELG